MYLQIVHLSHLSANVQSEVFVLAQFLMFYFVYKNNYFTFTVNLGRLCVMKVNVLDCLARVTFESRARATTSKAIRREGVW